MKYVTINEDGSATVRTSEFHPQIYLHLRGIASWISSGKGWHVRAENVSRLDISFCEKWAARIDRNVELRPSRKARNDARYEESIKASKVSRTSSLSEVEARLLGDYSSLVFMTNVNEKEVSRELKRLKVEPDQVVVPLLLPRGRPRNAYQVWTHRWKQTEAANGKTDWHVQRWVAIRFRNYKDHMMFKLASLPGIIVGQIVGPSS